jgi:hypothetical protein
VCVCVGGWVVILTFYFTPASDGAWVVNAKPWPPYPRKRGPVPIELEARWAPWPVCTGAENLAPTGIRSSVRSVASRYTDCAVMCTYIHVLYVYAYCMYIYTYVLTYILVTI